MIERDRVAVITGATGGMGSVAARGLAENGARLALLSTNMEKLQALAGELGLEEERVLLGAFDLTQPDAAQEAAAAVIEKFGKVDILLHLVGGWVGGTPVASLASSEVVDMLDQHLWSTFHLAQAFGPHLTANGWGRIIVVSSPTASSPPANMAPYVVGKAAQEALMLTLAKEMGPAGVTANVLHVRAIDAKHERDLQPTSKNANWTTPEEITAAILYICSDHGRAVNGARVPLYRGG